MFGSLFNRIFRNGSRTYFFSSLFFPPKIRDEITTLYCFVRVADDFVDSIPQQKCEFEAFCERTDSAFSGEITGDSVIDSFVNLARTRRFERAWVKAFLDSMRMDLYKERYETISELEEYMHGSAETVGAMISRILELPEDSYPYALKLGKSMQLINFLRDVTEDLDLGRQYIPQEDLERFGLKSLDESEVLGKRDAFVDLMRFEIERYFSWCGEAENGFSYVPRRYLVPIKTASDMYKWTAWSISRNPLVVYQRKVKPTARRVLTHGAMNCLTV